MSYIKSMDAPTTKTYKIPEYNLLSFKAQIEKLNKKVAKLQKKGYAVQPITYEVGAAIITKVALSPYNIVERIFFPVTVTASPIKANGWEFIATVQHEDGGNIVMAVPGLTQEGELAAYRTAAPSCDHCGYKRQRNDTFIVRKTEVANG
jgi:hypothetical protein